MSLVTKLVDTLSYTGIGQLRTTKCNQLDTRINGRIAHLLGWNIEVDADPVYTTDPTIVGHNRMISRFEFAVAGQTRFNLSGNGARMFERLENGGHTQMEAIDGASDGNRYWSRWLPLGPARTRRLKDYAMCVGSMVQDGELRITSANALADISADTTSFAMTVYVYAVYWLADEVNVPPMFERREDVVAVGELISGQSLLHEVALCNSTSFDAITAGDWGNITLEAGTYNPVPSVPAQGLYRAYNAMANRGEIGSLIGEPRSSTDVAQRRVNDATATAIAAQTADLQPVLWQRPGDGITEAHYCPANAKLSWSGTQVASGNVRLVGRTLRQSGQVYGEMFRRAEDALGTKLAGAKVKTASKADYKGPFAEFFPWTAKPVGR